MAKNKNKKNNTLAASKNSKAAKVETPETKAPKIEAPKVEESKAEKPKIEDTKVENTKVEKTKAPVPPVKESKKEEPKPASTSKVETPKPAAKPAVKTDSNITTIASVIGTVKEGERLSADSTVQLLGLVERNYKNNPGVPAELANSMARSFDMMMINSVMTWNRQFAQDMGEKGIKVNNEIFEGMANAFATYLGITLKALPTPDGQTMIDFNESIKDAPEDAKKVIEAEATVIQVEEIPAIVSSDDETTKIEKLRSIMSMKNGMENNVKNAVAFAIEAFDMKDAEPAQVLATIINKLGTDKPSLLLNGCARALYGMLMETQTPFAPQSWLKNKFPFWNDTQLANIAKVLLSYNMKLQSEKVGADYQQKFLTPYSTLLSSCNDDLINRIIDDAMKDNPDGVQMKSGDKPLAIPGLLVDKIPSQKVVNYIKTAYGASLAGKLLKKQMQDIMSLYTKPISPLEAYAEKSAYAK